MRTLKEELLLKVTRTLYGLSIQTGTISDMHQLEDNFVAGSWIASFLQNQEPKKRKRKHQNKNKGQKKAKENQLQQNKSKG